MQGQKNFQAKMFVNFCLADHIMKDNYYRVLIEILDLQFIKKKTQFLQNRQTKHLSRRVLQKKITEGNKQLYGSQFAKVDPVTKTVELAPTEDLINLDKRRREMGMMPIEMYKRFMLKSFD